MQVVLVMFRSDGERRSFSVTRDVTVIGRREDCDLRIPLSDVSRKHCRILRDGDTLRLEDLGSSNGTYSNGQRIQEVEVAPGDTIQIGPVIFCVQIDGLPDEADMAPMFMAPEAPAEHMTSDESAAPYEAPVAAGEEELESAEEAPAEEELTAEELTEAEEEPAIPETGSANGDLAAIEGLTEEEEATSEEETLDEEAPAAAEEEELSLEEPATAEQEPIALEEPATEKEGAIAFEEPALEDELKLEEPTAEEESILSLEEPLELEETPAATPATPVSTSDETTAPLTDLTAESEDIFAGAEGEEELVEDFEIIDEDESEGSHDGDVTIDTEHHK